MISHRYFNENNSRKGLIDHWKINPLDNEGFGCYVEAIDYIVFATSYLKNGT